MKLKHIGAIFLYFATFTLSVLIVGLPTTKSRSSQICPVEKQTVVVQKETDLQKRLRKFLEDDLQTGIELANDKARLSQSNGLSKAEELATSDLVKKMYKVKCDSLPEDFCTAWIEHRNAWTAMDYYLAQDFRNAGKRVKFQSEHKRALSSDIERTYQKMLAAARRYGVDFKY